MVWALRWRRVSKPEARNVLYIRINREATLSYKLKGEAVISDKHEDQTSIYSSTKMEVWLTVRADSVQAVNMSEDKATGNILC